ncbi:MAG TPA: undecaprenyl-diphosphatase UppP [Candidatus Limnocylindrales bacterium]|nr:undecaprenyl-diphosphatase UppP [Candidatus Limnocylindrales bacterium]
MDVGLIRAAVLGIVQGLTEFLPISSSAHLIVIPRLLGWNDAFIDSTAFDVMLHLGTLAALLVYFRNDLVRLLRAWLESIRDRRLEGDPERRLAWLLVVSVIPAAILGAALESFFDQAFRQHYQWIAVFALVGAAFLWLGERRKSAPRTLDQMQLRDAVTIGVAQAAALFPGISRSGITIGTGMLLGLSREAAARFSFLMAVPVIAGAGIWKARTLVGAGLNGAEIGQLAVGVVTSAIFGFLAIAALLRFLRTNPTTVFVVYRIAFAAVIVVAWLGLWDR